MNYVLCIMYKKPSILLVILLLSLQTFAQLKPNTHIVRGRVIDAKTKVHIPYALIRIKNTAQYKMSDANGDFELIIPYAYWRKKTIKFEAKANAYEVNSFEIETKKRKKNQVLILKMKAKSVK